MLCVSKTRSQGVEVLRHTIDTLDVSGICMIKIAFGRSANNKNDESNEHETIIGNCFSDVLPDSQQLCHTQIRTLDIRFLYGKIRVLLADTIS